MGQKLGRVSSGQVKSYTVIEIHVAKYGIINTLAIILKHIPHTSIEKHIYIRVDSWMTFKGKTPYGQQKAEKVKKVKKAKFSPIGFRPPKPKPEQRM